MDNISDTLPEKDTRIVQFRRVPGASILFDVMIDYKGTSIVILSQTRSHIEVMLKQMGIVILKID